MPPWPWAPKAGLKGVCGPLTGRWQSREWPRAWLSGVARRGGRGLINHWPHVKGNGCWSRRAGRRCPDAAADPGRTLSLPGGDHAGQGGRSQNRDCAGSERAQSPPKPTSGPHVGSPRRAGSAFSRHAQASSGVSQRDPRTAGDHPRQGRLPPATCRTELRAVG